MGDLAKLKNIGEKTEQWLNEVGIDTPEQLAMIGVVEAWKRVRNLHPEATLVGLYALQGAMLNMRWNDLPDEMKAELKAQFEE